MIGYCARSCMVRPANEFSAMRYSKLLTLRSTHACVMPYRFSDHAASLRKRIHSGDIGSDPIFEMIFRYTWTTGAVGSLIVPPGKFKKIDLPSENVTSNAVALSMYLCVPGCRSAMGHAIVQPGGRNNNSNRRLRLPSSLPHYAQLLSYIRIALSLAPCCYASMFSPRQRTFCPPI